MMIAPVNPPPPRDTTQRASLVLFGATGDLARRKIVPALFRLASGGHLPEGTPIVGVSRSAGDDDRLRDVWREGLKEHLPTDEWSESLWDVFSRRIHAVAGAVDDEGTYLHLRDRLDVLDVEHATGGNRLVYLATPASAFPPILRGIAAAGVVKRRAQAREESNRTGTDPQWGRVIIEKPFGRDRESARELNDLALLTLDEKQVFRIDHYLGKETVQNILVFRFGNAIFEPLWNRNHIDHVQITVAESLGVEGRGEFYEETGVVRDIVQNHLLQMLALCAMEPPASMRSDEIRNMKAQVLASLRPIEEFRVAECVVPGQYVGYRNEKGVAPDSVTPTYVAVEANIDNWRWQGVPFYLRSGKGLARRSTEISIHFKRVPYSLFGEDRVCHMMEPNVLTLRIQPEEGISMRIATKMPNQGLKVGAVHLDFDYADHFDTRAPDAYERLILDAWRGDSTLFARRDEVELSWRWCDPILEAWEKGGLLKDVATYERGSEGPKRAEELPRRNGHRWVRLMR
ncbi:MAG: glucose-6-phosphate dehydrogenase [Planctomycetota bacterium]